MTERYLLVISMCLTVVGAAAMWLGMRGNWQRITLHDEQLIQFGMMLMFASTIFMMMFLWIADGWRLG